MFLRLLVAMADSALLVFGKCKSRQGCEATVTFHPVGVSQILLMLGPQTGMNLGPPGAPQPWWKDRLRQSSEGTGNKLSWPKTQHCHDLTGALMPVTFVLEND
jgi:hypothetical protein